MKTLWTELRAGLRRMRLHYTGPGAALNVMALALRCLLCWAMGCVLLFMAYGGLLLFYLNQRPELVATTVPGLQSVVHETVTRWRWQCVAVLSWALPLFCLWLTLARFIPGPSVNADRTRIPFDPRR